MLPLSSCISHRTFLFGPLCSGYNSGIETFLQITGQIDLHYTGLWMRRGGTKQRADRSVGGSHLLWNDTKMPRKDRSYVIYLSPVESCPIWHHASMTHQESVTGPRSLLHFSRALLGKQAVFDNNFWLFGLRHRFWWARRQTAVW